MIRNLFNDLFKYKEKDEYNFILPNISNNLDESNFEKKDNTKIYTSLEKNCTYLKSKYNMLISSDVKMRNFTITLKSKKIPAFLIYIDGMVEDKSINEFIMQPLLLRNSIKMQYNEIYKSQDLEITKQNKKKIEDLVFATQDLIDNCIKDTYYSGNRDETFVNLIYICHKLDLKLETYKLTEKMQELESKSKELMTRQNDAEEKNNNLVYNLLGFLVF